MKRLALSLKMFSRALNILQHQGRFSKDLDSTETAKVILDQPTFGRIVVDNYLDNQVRTLFYKLEESGLTQSFSEFVKISKNNYWRIHFWKLNFEEIERLSLLYE